MKSALFQEEQEDDQAKKNQKKNDFRLNNP